MDKPTLELIRTQLNAYAPCGHEDREKVGLGDQFKCHVCGCYIPIENWPQEAEKVAEHEKALDAVVAELRNLEKAPAESPAYDRIEYRLLHINGVTNTMNEVDQYGRDGWELCGKEWGMFILKRKSPVEVTSDTPQSPVVNLDLQAAQQRIETLERDLAAIRASHDALVEVQRQLLSHIKGVDEINFFENLGDAVVQLIQLRDKWRAIAQAREEEGLRNLSRWAEMLGCGLSPEQPELLVVIDEALGSYAESRKEKQAQPVQEGASHDERVAALSWSRW